MPYVFPVWEAFDILSGCRSYIATPVGVMAAPITFESIDRYAHRFAIEGEDFEEFLTLILRLDSVFLSLQSEQNKND